MTKLLNWDKIQYKWLFPEGLNFQWDGKPIKLDSISKVLKFANDNAQKLVYETSSEEFTSNAETQPEDNQPYSSQQGGTRGVPKPPRYLRQRTITKNISNQPWNSTKFYHGKNNKAPGPSIYPSDFLKLSLV